LQCFGHRLHLAIENAVKGDERILRAVGLCKKLVRPANLELQEFFTAYWSIKNLFVTEGTTQRDQAGSMEREFKRARNGFPAHSLAPDQPSPLPRLLILFLVLFQRGSWMNRLHTPILFLVLFRRGSWMNRRHTPIKFLVLFRRGSWMNRLHTPILFLVLFRRGPKPSRPHTLFLPGWEDAPSPPAVPQRLRRRSPRPRRMSQQSLHRSPRFQRFPHRTSELHCGFSWSRRWPSDHWLLRHRPADHLLLRRQPADRLLIASSYVASLLITCSYVAGLLIA
ncbi:hypothetical protein AMECASPLE_027938, partial [Ameca splendens]